MIHETAVIYPGVFVYPTAYVGPFCVLGAPPEQRGHQGPGKGVFIGPNVRLEKSVVIDSGVSERTYVGAYAMLMSGSHVGHDAKVGYHATLSPKAVVGGHAIIGNYASLGIGASVHQHQRVGAGAFIGAGAFLPKNEDVLPFQTWGGVPAKYLKENDYLLRKLGVSPQELHTWRLQFINGNNLWYISF